MPDLHSFVEGSEGGSQQVQWLPGKAAVRGNLLIGQCSIEHVDAGSDQVVVLDGWDDSSLSSHTQKHGGKNVAQGFACRTRHTRRDVGDTVVVTPHSKNVGRS